MRQCAVFLLLVGLAAGLAHGSEAPRWEAVLEGLRHADFATRQAAQSELNKTTPSDLARLREIAAAERDPEVKARLADRVMALEDEIATNPPRISLELRNATIADVAAALGKAMDIRITAVQSAAMREARFTVNLKDKTFPEVIAALSEQYPVTLQAAPRDELRLTTDSMGSRKIQVAGPVGVSATRIQKVRALNLQAPPADQLLTEQVTLQGQVIIDPRLQIWSFAMPTIVHIADNANNVLLRREPPELMNAGAANTIMTTALRSFSTSFNLPRNVGRRITVAQGVVRYSVAVTNDELEIPEAAKKIGQPIAFAGKTVTIKKLDVNDRELQFALEMPREAVIAVEAGGAALVEAARRPTLSISIVDNLGKKVWSSSSLQGSVSGRTMTAEPIGLPLKVVLRQPRRIKEVTVPFEFRDIPLP